MSRPKLSGQRLVQLTVLAQGGRSLPEIGARLGVTRQCVDHLLRMHGLHQAWKAAREAARAAQEFRTILSRRSQATRPLLYEARELGLTVALHRELGVTVEGLRLRVLTARRPWRPKVNLPTHPGYFRWRYGEPRTLYVVLFPQGGRRFHVPPHPPRTYRVGWNGAWVRADAPATRRREPWPSQRMLRAAARAVREAGRKAA